MKWLSLGTVDKRELGPRDAYGWHEAVWEMFPGRHAHNRRDVGFLFRVDELRSHFQVHVLSELRPALPAWGAWRTKEVATTFLDHARYRFKLKANPTVRRKEDGRRLGLFKEELLMAWMLRKAAENGFAVDDGTLRIGAALDERFWHKKLGKLGKHTSVDFEGVLRVTEREAFRQAFGRGLGSAKGFGFGLLMLVPMG